jgi:hypothetical protein
VPQLRVQAPLLLHLRSRQATGRDHSPFSRPATTMACINLQSLEQPNSHTQSNPSQSRTRTHIHGGEATGPKHQEKQEREGSTSCWGGAHGLSSPVGRSESCARDVNASRADKEIYIRPPARRIPFPPPAGQNRRLNTIFGRPEPKSPDFSPCSCEDGEEGGGGSGTVVWNYGECLDVFSAIR